MIVLGSRLGLLIAVPSHMAAQNSTCSANITFWVTAGWPRGLPSFFSSQISITPTMSISSSIFASRYLYTIAASPTLRPNHKQSELGSL